MSEQHQLAEHLKVENMMMDLNPADKQQAIENLIDKLASSGALAEENVQAAKDAVLKRENLGSTGIGNGIAIPHAMVGFTDTFICAYGHVDGGMDFSSIDGEPVYAVFLLLSPESKVDNHLGLMKELATFSRAAINYNFLKTCASSESVLDLLQDWKEEE